MIAQLEPDATHTNFFFLLPPQAAAERKRIGKWSRC
jgi:hypothetical protein